MDILLQYDLSNRLAQFSETFCIKVCIVSSFSISVKSISDFIFASASHFLLSRSCSSSLKLEVSSELKLLTAFARQSFVIDLEVRIDSKTGTKCGDFAYSEIEFPLLIKLNNTFLSGSSPANFSSSMP